MFKPIAFRSLALGALTLSTVLHGIALQAAETVYTTIDQLPAPVQVTLRKEAKGASLSHFEKEEVNGEVVYSAEIEGKKAGTIIEFSVNPLEQLLSQETEEASVEGTAADLPVSVAPITTLGDLTAYRTLAIDTRDLVTKHDSPGAVTKITDLETAWDVAEGALRAKNGKDWRILDKALDKALSQVRADKPDAENCVKALTLVIELCPAPAGSAK